MKYRRIFTIVIDSMGIGAMPNAAEYGDEGCDTLGHIDLHMPKFKIPHMAELGITRLHPLTHVKEEGEPKGHYGRLFEASVGKDTMTGHWEMMGLYITQPFKTFTDTGLTKRDRKNGWGHMSAAPILHAATNIVQSIIYDRMF